MKAPYIVRVDRPVGYPPKFFPKKFINAGAAKAAAQAAVDKGAAMARVEFPDGSELDFRPKQGAQQ
jgi:hypothetical protein